MNITEFLDTLKPADATIKNCVYCAYNKLTSKVYVGYTKTSLYRRKVSHYYNAKHKPDNNYFHNSLHLSNKNDIDWYILYQDSNLKNLTDKEVYFIKLFQSNDKNFGYNLTTGGDSPTFSRETRDKISKKAKARNLNGKNNPFYGKTHSKETREHLSRVRTGICNNRGYKHSLEMRKKISDRRHELCKNPKHIEIMQNAQKSKPIHCITNNAVYKSIAEAARQLNILKGGIKDQLHGRRKTYKGLQFEFIS